eukprot:scaffold5310_cov54-Attheya_sp.AAC.7
MFRNGFKRGLALYSSTLEKNPLLTQMTTSAALWCAGDLFAQMMENGNRENSIIQSIDWHRTALQGGYASCIWAPFAHHWYEILDKVAVRIAKTTSQTNGRFLATKMALEIVALHPLSLLAFFGFIGIMNGETTQEIASQLQRDFIPTLGLEIALWTPLDITNFTFVPVRHQLFVVNCACFFESVFLSYIKANGVEILGSH